MGRGGEVYERENDWVEVGRWGESVVHAAMVTAVVFRPWRTGSDLPVSTKLYRPVL